jgi:transcriptional regulator with XRE-family HTH domain
MTKQTLGMMIAAKRKEKGMTQSELAAKMGVTDKAVSKWERDLSCPDIQSLPILADIFHVSVNELIQIKKNDEDYHSSPEMNHIVDLILKGVSIAMGTAVIVLSFLNKIDMKSGFCMLGIATVCLTVYLFRKDDKQASD